MRDKLSIGRRLILDTIYCYAENKEQEFSNSPRALPQLPLFVGNAVRTVTFWAQFDKILLLSHPMQCLISIGQPSKEMPFNIVKYGNRIGVMGYAYDHYPQHGQVKHNLTEWNHYGIVYDGKFLTIYINGQVDTQIERRYKTAAIHMQNNFIGQSNHNGCECPFYGKIKELRFYGKNLNAKEINLLMS